MTIFSVYDYFIADCLVQLTRIPIENQLKECLGLKVAVLDYCGIMSTCFNKFTECDVYVVKNIKENVMNSLKEYDIIYVATNELQFVTLEMPHLRIICKRAKILRVELGEKPINIENEQNYEPIGL
ncbi:hypothetical protein GINT2_001135 [Glugoides intestinalis]